MLTVVLKLWSQRGWENSSRKHSNLSHWEAAMVLPLIALPQLCFLSFTLSLSLTLALSHTHLLCLSLSLICYWPFVLQAFEFAEHFIKTERFTSSEPTASPTASSLITSSSCWLQGKLSQVPGVAVCVFVSQFVSQSVCLSVFSSVSDEKTDSQCCAMWCLRMLCLCDVMCLRDC